MEAKRIGGRIEAAGKAMGADRAMWEWRVEVAGWVRRHRGQWKPTG